MVWLAFWKLGSLFWNDQTAGFGANQSLSAPSKPPNSVAKEKECIVCAVSKPAARFPLLPVSRDCSHAPGTCLDCLERHIKIAIYEKAWHARVVTCPECNGAIEYDEVRMYADRATFDKYDMRVLNDVVSRRSDWFSCPKAGCGAGQIHEAVGDAPIVTCIGCRRKYCFRHGVPWHEAMSCEEYDRFLEDPDNFRSAFEIENEQAEREREAEEIKRRAKENRASEKLVKRTTKKCPGCTWPIEKNEGCAHMTCIICKHSFCYDCLADYKKIIERDNSAHKKRCPWHPSNLSLK